MTMLLITIKLGFEVVMDKKFGENHRLVSFRVTNSSLELPLGFADMQKDSQARWKISILCKSKIKF
jgi:hypothetical protein